MNKETKFKRAPLPFQGQKRQFYTHYIDALSYFPDGVTYIDVFGGSGLLSRWTKDKKPNARVIYNDFDNYSWRLKNFDTTKELCTQIKAICTSLGIEDEGKITKEAKGRIKLLLEDTPHELLDFKTLGGWIRFSGNFYEGNEIKGLLNTPLYNRIPKTYLQTQGYLDGLEVVSMNFKELLEQYQGQENIVLILDPPYIFTERKSYTGYFRLKEFLSLMHLIENSNFIYFSSERSEFHSYILHLKELGIDNSISRATCTGSIISSINKGGRYIDHIYISGGNKNE